MIQRTLGHIWLLEAFILEAEHAAAELKSLATGGRIVADPLGLDKTVLVLFLFINSTVN